MPGSARWGVHCEQDMLRRENQGALFFEEGFNRKCWVCDQWIYTIIFWSKSIGFHCQS